MVRLDDDDNHEPRRRIRGVVSGRSDEVRRSAGRIERASARVGRNNRRGTQGAGVVLTEKPSASRSVVEALRTTPVPAATGEN